MTYRNNNGLGFIAGVLFFLAVIGLIILSFIGWVLNILALVGANAFGVLEVVRVIGIFVAPVGTILGWFA